MAIIDPLCARELAEKYTHRGWFLCCPIYAGDIDREDPLVVERNGIPAWWFAINFFLVIGFNWIGELMDPEWDPAFPSVFTGELHTAQRER